jgi:hypothetical protein
MRSSAFAYPLLTDKFADGLNQRGINGKLYNDFNLVGAPGFEPGTR